MRHDGAPRAKGTISLRVFYDNRHQAPANDISYRIRIPKVSTNQRGARTEYGMKEWRSYFGRLPNDPDVHRDRRQPVNRAVAER